MNRLRWNVHYILLLLLGIYVCSPVASAQQESPPVKKDAATEPIDFRRAKGYFDRRERGEKLTADEEAYLKRALEERRKQQGQRGAPQGPIVPKDKTGLKPLSEMTAEDRYQGEDGGLYGAGRNSPSDEHRRIADRELARIQPLDATGKPAPTGRIGFVSISMSNATQEFSRFKQLADADREKSPLVAIVDCAQGGQAMAEWAPKDARPWTMAEDRIRNAGLSNLQVQVAWIKLANKGPQGKLTEHGKQLQRDTQAVLRNAKERFPNLHIAYLGSRIYGGYTSGALNPEPYAYESAFVVRWLIQEQLKGESALNFDASRGDVAAPLLLWGPYCWADGVEPRGSDQLVWNRSDFAGDGTHPSDSGRDKVAGLLLKFFKNESLAKGWFVR